MTVEEFRTEPGRHRGRHVRRRVVGIAAITFALVGAACVPALPPHATPGTPTQGNTDAYQYPSVRDGIGDFVYNQLWYFNFLDDRGSADPTDDVAGVAAYGLANPENLLGQRGQTNSFGMIIRDPSEGSSFNLFSPSADPAVPGNFSASTTFEPGPGPELANPWGSIDVVGPDEYHVVGSVTDGSRTLSWDLDYRRGLGPGWLPWDHWPMPPTLGIVPAWITYHMQMPNAVVNGSYTVDDGSGPRTYELRDAKGYHDGFSSEFVFSIIEWDWLDYKGDDLAVQMLHPHAPDYTCGLLDQLHPCLPGNLRVALDGATYDFARGQVDIHYDAAAHDATYGADYPTSETITANDGAGNSLTLHWSLVRQLPVFYDVPAPFADTITYEIIASFDGTFHEAATGRDVPIAGTGWSDWSGTVAPTP